MTDETDDKPEEIIRDRFGRPTKFDEVETLKKVGLYLKKCPDDIPSLVGLAIYLNVTRNTLTNWAKKPGREHFLSTLESVSDFQHQMALNGGITNKYNPTIAKLVLANHGYHDKQDTDVSGNMAVVTLSQAEYKQARSEMLKEDDC